METDIVQKIVDAIDGDEELSEITAVPHTVVEGRTASYPVDLLLKFDSDNGIHYKILVSTSTASAVLTKKQLFGFAANLQDISGQVMGVMLTQPIYDISIKSLAKDAGINLYEMPGLSSDTIWEPLVGDIGIELDEEWVRTEKEKHNVAEQKISVSTDPDYAYLYNDAGACVDSLRGVFDEYVRREYARRVFEPLNIKHEFTGEARYLETGNELIPRIKLNGVKFSLRFRNLGELDGRDILINILRAALASRLN